MILQTTMEVFLKRITFISVLLLALTAGAAEVQTSQLEVSAVQPLNQIVSYHFGRTFVNSMMTVRYDITNRGYEVIPFEGAYVYGANYNVRHTCAAGIPAKSRCVVEIRYWPMFEGFHHGELDMLFANSNDVRFYLSGEA